MTMTPNERFWAKVQKSEGCWPWLASHQPSGRYGYFWFEGKVQSAHRVAFKLTNGAIPDGLCVLHKCDNPLCVNPAHLRLGTFAENTAEAVERGRHPTGSRHGAHTRPEATHRGERCSWSKLTEADVLNIRAAYQHGAYQSELAEQYDVRQTTISRIVLRQTWRSVA